jgi:hypothetical protein
MSKTDPPRSCWNRFPHVSMHGRRDVCGSVETAFPVPYVAACMGCWTLVVVHLARAHLPCRSLLWTEDMTCVGLCHCVGDWGARASCEAWIRWGRGVDRQIGLDAIGKNVSCGSFQTIEGVICKNMTWNDHRNWCFNIIYIYIAKETMNQDLFQRHGIWYTP